MCSIKHHTSKRGRVVRSLQYHELKLGGKVITFTSTPSKVC
jgi:hypothetical protein